VGFLVSGDVREPLKGGITRITRAGTGKRVFEARWSWVDEAGERQAKKETFPTLKLAQQARAKAMAAIAEHRYDAPTRMTVEDYAQPWLERRAREWASSTAYTRRRQYLNHIKPRMGNQQITKVTRHQCQQMADALAREYAPANVRNVMALVAALFNAAVRDGVLARSPATGLDLPAVRPVDHRIWTPTQLQGFLAATVDHPDHALYAVLVSTGMRIGEAIALRWPHINLERGTATITDTLRRAEGGAAFEPSPGTKTTKGRTIGLSETCMAVLVAHRAAQEARREAAPHWDPRAFVFDGRNGNHLDYPEVARRFKRVQEPLGYPPITLHDLRHSVATILMQQGVHVGPASAMLGHTVQVMLKSYVHHALADVQHASSALDSALSDTTTTTPQKG